MEILEAITVKGLTVAKANGLLDLQENYSIPYDEDKVKEFIQIQITDLFDFATLEQFLSNENLFLRSFLYTYGKGFEFALSYMVGEPLERIGYNFDDCMTSNGLKAVPKEILATAENKLHILREMYTEMFDITKRKQEELIKAGISFEDCIIKILNGAFFIGRRVAVSIELDVEKTIPLNSDKIDCKYDYDNYDQRYSI